jgi:hypothetical protein
MPATRRLAARVFLGVTEVARRRTPECMSCRTTELVFCDADWEKRRKYLVVSCRRT